MYEYMETNILIFTMLWRFKRDKAGEEREQLAKGNTEQRNVC